MLKIIILQDIRHKAGSEKPGLILKDIDSLVVSPVGHDIIVPSFSSTSSDPVMDITEAVEGDTRENQEKAERKLKFKVRRFVSTVLNSFYKQAQLGVPHFGGTI